jgi:mercuric ion binding protein
MLLVPPTVHTAAMGYTLHVDGLACPFCAYGVEKKLNSINGVEEIKVDIENGQVIVIMSDGSALSENDAREQVEKAGFTLRSFTPLEEDQ